MFTIPRGRPGRRSWATVLALTTVTALALSGCAGDSDDQPTQSSGGRAPLLTFAVSAPATGMNPTTVNTAFASYALAAYEPLVYFGPGGVYQPALAESWEIAEGNTAISLRLRSGVTFADGSPVDAAAVKASLEYCGSSASINALALRDLDSIELTDDLSLTLRLKQANPLLLNMVSQELGCGMIISPAGLAQIDDLTVDSPSAGAGAYVYDPQQSVPGDTYTYTANPRYYDPSKQHFDKLVLKVMMEPQAALNALTTGQVDVATGSLATAQQAAQSQSVEMSWIPVVWAGLNLIDRDGALTPAMGDVRVRQAINYAINREAITQAILGDFGVPTSSPAAEGYDGWTAQAASYYSYDPTKAKALLVEAGYPDGFELPVATVAWGGLDVVTTALTPMLAEIGITMVVNTTTDEKAYADAATNRQASAVAVGYGSLPMFRMATDLVLPEARPFNGFGTDDPEAMALLQELRLAAPEQSAERAQALNTYLVEQAWFAPVMFTPILIYYRDGVTGVDLTGGRQTVSILDVALK